MLRPTNEGAKPGFKCKTRCKHSALHLKTLTTGTEDLDAATMLQDGSNSKLRPVWGKHIHLYVHSMPSNTPLYTTQTRLQPFTLPTQLSLYDVYLMSWVKWEHQTIDGTAMAQNATLLCASADMSTACSSSSRCKALAVAAAAAATSAASHTCTPVTLSDVCKCSVQPCWVLSHASLRNCLVTSMLCANQADDLGVSNVTLL